MAALDLDTFMVNLRELPEFADWNDEQFQQLYANEYLPMMQEKEGKTPQGLINSGVNIDPYAGTDPSLVSADAGGVPVNLSLQRKPGSITGDATLHRGRNDAITAYGGKSLTDKRWGVGVQYQKRF